MSTPRWTPGPWEVAGHYIRTLISNDGGVEIGRTDLSFQPLSERTANAVLMAKAPQLYEMLEAACIVLERAGRNTDKARALLAEARGDK